MMATCELEDTSYVSVVVCALLAAWIWQRYMEEEEEDEIYSYRVSSTRLMVPRPQSGFEITRGYRGFWVFEALLNEVRVRVFVGMGFRNKNAGQ